MPEQEMMPDVVLMHWKYPPGLFHISTLFIVLIVLLLVVFGKRSASDLVSLEKILYKMIEISWKATQDYFI